MFGAKINPIPGLFWITSLWLNHATQYCIRENRPGDLTSFAIWAYLSHRDHVYLGSIHEVIQGTVLDERLDRTLGN
jgi:hypothetical protein